MTTSRIIGLGLILAMLSGCTTYVKTSYKKGPDDTIEATTLVLGTGTKSDASSDGSDSSPEGAILGISKTKQDSSQWAPVIQDIMATVGPILLTRALGLTASALPSGPDAGDTAVSAQPVGWTTEATSQSYSGDGYGATPGDNGGGVYGRPSCGRCQAYRRAHPDTEMINIDDPSARSAMWAALRARGYTASSIDLPVAITENAYTEAAR